MDQVVKKFTLKDLTINDESPKAKYRSRQGENKKAVHWGQRKLLLSEIEFFTIYWDRKKIQHPTCVYAGAGPGTHIPILSLLFPEFKFHLYDPNTFGIKETDKIKIFNEYFTNDTAAKYTGRDDIFFISDIRTVNPRKIERSLLVESGINEFTPFDKPIGDKNIIKNAIEKARVVVEDQVWGDNLMQQQWVLTMNPEHALLKFRLPYPIDNVDRYVTYLDGTVYWQCWQPQSSTETRLKPSKNNNGQYEFREWSITDYEERCFYHNSITREKSAYLNPFTNDRTFIDPPELLDDFDSTLEAFILAMYFDRRGTNNVKNSVINLSRFITKSLTKTYKRKISLSMLRQLPHRSLSINSQNIQREKKGLTPITGRVNFTHSNIAIDPSWRS